MGENHQTPSRWQRLSLLGRRDTRRDKPQTQTPAPAPKAATMSPPPAMSSARGGYRAEVDKAFDTVGQLYKQAMAPVHPEFVVKPTNEASVASGDLFNDLRKMGFQDVETLLKSFYSQTKGVQDDNDMLLEKLVSLLAKLPANSRNAQSLTDSFINQLWEGLPHPPASYLGDKYKYRDADGGNNNIRNPDLGRANTPYARSTKPTTMTQVGLPDPGAIFDSLMARDENKFEPHPQGVSSMLFYQASIIIHDCFRTDHKDFNNSKTSSYLDLAPLYGSNWEEQKAMRTFKEGKIKPDCFSEKRLLGFPPGVGVLLIMYNRFHNYVVSNLATINQDNRFTKPKDENDTAAYEKYDNDLFQTGRLITCGLYVNVILKDYVRTILALNRTSSTWDLDPRASDTKSLLYTPAPEGCGNSVSAEFNLCYRWHSAVSQKDDKWTQEVYANMFPGKKPEEVSLRELLMKLGQMEATMSADPQARPFANLSRQEDGTYNDDGLVEILTSSIEDVAGAFGANHVPKILRSVEILGIMQARSWNLGTLNEFRAFFGLARHKTFEDINPDPAVQAKLKNLYDAPDFVELYPGLVSEKAKPPVNPGSGLCVGFTISRAILSDAVALVRGDRFYTTDYHPRALTNWGFAESNFDTAVDLGHVAYKLIYHAFPNHFKGDSIYAHYPFVVPSENAKIQESLGTKDKYSWDRPKRVPEVIVVKSYNAATQILSDKTTFKVTWGAAIKALVNGSPKTNYGANYCLAGDEPVNLASRKLVMKALMPKNWESEVKKFYIATTRKLLTQYSYQIAGVNQVDIVRDIAGLANTHFSASVFSLPLKTETSPHGIYNEQELTQVLSVLFMAIFYDIDPSKSFMLRGAAHTLAQQLGQLVLLNVEAIASTGVIADIVAKLHTQSALSDYGTHMIQRLLESGQSIKDVVWTQLLPTAASMVANQAQLFSQVLDYYLTDGKEHLPALYKLANQDTPEADASIMRYFLEGGRMRATAGLFRDAAVATSVRDGTDTIKVPQGRRVLVDMVLASKDPVQFPDPDKVKLDRDIDSYIHYGWGPHLCAGVDPSKIAMATMLKEIVKLPGLRRAPGVQGELKKIPAPYGYTTYLTQDWSSIYPVPVSMKIQWDGPAPR